LPPPAQLPRGFSPEGLAFSFLAAIATVMAAGYALDLAGLPMRSPVLAIVFAGALAVSGWRFSRDSTTSVESALVAGFIGAILVASGYMLWLAAPSLLPVTTGPDVVHHLQLIHLIQRTDRLAHDPSLQPYLLEMMNYTPGSHILAAAIGDWARVDALRVVQPIAAVLTGVKAGLVYLIAVRVSTPLRTAGVAALAAPVLAFVPAVYTLGSSFHFFFYAQVVSEAFAIGMLLAIVWWRRNRGRSPLAAFAACAVGVFLSWPVWLGPGVGVLIASLLLARVAWSERVTAATIALAPVTLVAAVHTLIHAEGGRILTASGAVTAPSLEVFGLVFLILAAIGVVLVGLRVRAAVPVVLFLLAALGQAAVLAVMAIRAGSTSFYLPFKMMYLVVFPAAILGAVALVWFADLIAARVRRMRMAAALAPVVVALMLAAGRVPPGKGRSPINEPSYAVGLWARDHVPPGCVDYFSSHWLTGYWLHLDVFGNPRDSVRMRAESFEFRDSVGKWIEGRGLPYAFVENLSDIPRELRSEMLPLHTVGSAALVRNARPSDCR
jgi:hypothetical protein